MEEQPKVIVTQEETVPSLIPDGSVAHTNPEMVATAAFGTYLPRFKLLMKGLSGKAKDRVINAIIEVPLNERDFRPQNAQEKETFLIGQALLNAKRIIIDTTLMKHEKEVLEMEKARAEANSEQTNEGE